VAQDFAPAGSYHVRAKSGEQFDRRPQLRLVTVEEAAEATVGLSPKMTLTELYHHWFEDVVLIGERDAADSTLVLWRKSLDWWALKTGDPPLNQIDEHTLAGFHVAMRTATYSRAKIGGTLYNVEPITQKRIVQHVQAVLSRAGQKKLLDDVPRLRIKRVRTRKKPAFASEQIAAIFTAASRMRRPLDLSPSTGEFWLGLNAFALISGVRKGTFFALEWDWFVQRSDGWWVEFPDHAVPKTERGVCVAIPEWLRIFLFRWPRTSARVFGSPWSLSHWDDCFVELQLAAGIHSPLPFQAWRRTLAEEMVRSGAAFGLRMAQAGLDHRDSGTTEDFYAGSANIFRRSYPPLFYVPPEDGQRRLFD
jgi:integrase